MLLDLDIDYNRAEDFKTLIASLGDDVKIVDYNPQGPAGGNPCFLLNIKNEAAAKAIWEAYGEFSVSNIPESYEEFIQLHECQ